MTTQSETKTTLRDFVTKALRREGAVVEESQSGLEFLLPPSLAETLGVEEDWSLHENSPDSATRLAYGVPWLEDLIERVEGEGRLACLEFSSASELGVRQSGILGELKLRLNLLGANHDFGRTFASQATYTVLVFEYDARSGVLREGGQSWVAINEDTGAEAPWFPFEELEKYSFREVSNFPLRRPISFLHRQLEEVVQQEIASELEEFLLQRERRALRMRRQLERLHRRERKDILHPLLQSEEGADEEEILAELQEAEDLYLEELADIPQQFPLQLQARPVAVVRVTMPVAKVECTLRYRKEQRVIHWIWNPILGGFEPLVCEETGKSSFRFHVSSDLELLISPPGTQK